MVVDSRGQAVADAEVWKVLDDQEFLAPTIVATTDPVGRFSFPVHATKVVYVFARSVGRAPSRVATVFLAEDGLKIEVG